jgi:hypothetical protein
MAIAFSGSGSDVTRVPDTGGVPGCAGAPVRQLSRYG